MPDFAFDPHATTYSSVNACALARLANLAYGTEADIKSQTKDWGFDTFEFFNVDETQAFLAANADAIVVGFRGTSNINNWMTDLTIHLTGGPLGRVHEGFLAALNLVWLGLLQAILDTQRSSVSVSASASGAHQSSSSPSGPARAPSLWFTGHSLGGALATLAVAKLIERAQPVDGLYTCGCPRCGDGAFAANFNSLFTQGFRFVYNEDIVTRIPPRIPFGYRHVGTVKHIDTNCQITGELEGWANFLRTVEITMAALETQNLSEIEDHQMKNYLHCLEQNAGGGSPNLRLAADRAVCV